MRVDDTYDLYNDLIRTKTATINVSPPGSFELDEGLRKALCCRAAFHNAELSEEERLFVEERIAAGKVDVVFATSTLAAGVNFPLGSAVFATWTRWNVERRIHEPIGRAEFQNMAGRVGRMGQAAAEGLVILCADGGSELNNARKLMDLGAQDELGNGIIPEDFGMLTLQLFAGKLCARRDDAFDMIASTLSAAHPWGRLAGAWVPYGAGLFSPHCMPMLPLLPAGSRNAAGDSSGRPRRRRPTIDDQNDRSQTRDRIHGGSQSLVRNRDGRRRRGVRIHGGIQSQVRNRDGRRRRGVRIHD